MPYSETAEEYIKDFKELINEWKPREEALKESYKLLSLHDELYDWSSKPEDRMESFVSNDPRVIHNMALFLLTPRHIPHNIPSDNVDEVTQVHIANIEREIRRQWDKLDQISLKSSNGGSWLYYFNNLMLATGWYAVFAIATGDEFIADIWNPAETFPEFDQDGMSRVLNHYTISASRARKKIKDAGWNIKIDSNIPVPVYNYWCYDDDGFPHNCVILGNQKAKEESYPQLPEIPVFVSGIAGLPDRGVMTGITDVDDWHATIGQSLSATNKPVFKARNRQMSFMQQIIRDTAQPRIVEKVKGGTRVVNKNNWNKRGAIYHLDTDEDIGAVPMPGMPPELSMSLQMMEGMIQRGGFDYSLFQGGQASAAAQAITSASAQQVLLPFKDARDYVLSSIANIWLHCVKIGMAQFPTYDLPRGLPDLEFKTEIAISVPGDLIQRATTMRQLNPNAKLSMAKTLELTMPEIIDPNDEVIRGRVDTAMQNPAFGTIDMIEAMISTAEALEVEGNLRHAARYRNLAAQLEQNLANAVQGQENQQAPQGLPGQANVGQ